jgi:hypothetical protein
VPGAGTHPVWHVWHDDGDERGTGPAAYVVSGPGEQSLPWLPDEVELVLRSKDSGGLLLSVRATSRELTPADEEWDAAVQVLRPERLNAVGDVAQRWAQGCTIHVLTPHGGSSTGPGRTRPTPAACRSRPGPGPPRGGVRGTGAAGPAPAATPSRLTASAPPHPDSLCP